MMAETYIAIVLLTLAVGVLIGMWYCWLVAVRPVDQADEDRRRAELRAMRQRYYREQARREHRGTPYIKPAASDLERLLSDIATVDDHNGSRKAPELRVVS